MAQERLKELTLLNIEATWAKVMEMDTLVDTFAKIKARRKQLFNFGTVGLYV